MEGSSGDNAFKMKPECFKGRGLSRANSQEGETEAV